MLELPEEGYVLGADVETIVMQLHDRHPPKHPSGTMIYPETRSRTDWDHNAGRNRTITKRVWYLLKYPFCASKDIDELRSISVSAGTLLVENSHAAPYIEANFTVRGSRLGKSTDELMRVRYSPETFARRPYYEEKKAYEKRISCKLSRAMSHGLMSRLCDWPPDHPARDIGRPPELYISGGWRTNPAEFSMEAILAMRDTLLRLDKCKFWRGKENDDYEWREALRPVLDRIHAIEAQAREDIARLEPEEDEDCNPCKWWEERLRFCRWLRVEARAMKVKMPRKPVKPLTPAQKARNRKRSKKKRKRG